jgi:hypothetical protein
MTLNKNASKQKQINAGSPEEGGYRRTSRVPSRRPSEGGCGCVGDGHAHNQIGILSHIRAPVRAAFEIVGSRLKYRLSEEHRPGTS